MLYVGIYLLGLLLGGIIFNPLEKVTEDEERALIFIFFWPFTVIVLLGGFLLLAPVSIGKYISNKIFKTQND